VIKEFSRETRLVAEFSAFAQDPRETSPNALKTFAPGTVLRRVRRSSPELHRAE
jgi:hypothetical protein